MATKLNLILDQGSTFTQEILLTDDNDDDLVVTEDMEASAQMRKSYFTSNVIIFTCTLANGSLRLDLTANQTTALVPGRYVWDAEINNDGTVTRLIEGIITVTPDA